MKLTLPRPDDWHVHFRDGAMLGRVVPETARHFGRALVMPNLVPPVVTTDDAIAYRARIMAAVPDGPFEPQMTLYLTETTDAEDVIRGWEAGVIRAVKLYPAGATTNSASGVREIERVLPVLEAMAAAGLTLCVHGEVTTPEIDIFDREAVFIDTVLAPLKARLPDLRVTMEHVTTKDGIDYIAETDRIAGTITTHHLMINRNDLLVGGIRPHYYCLPVVKRESHRQALRAAATSANPKYFLGTDSAPHEDATKEAACGCAGCFTATNTLSCLAHVFEEEGALDALAGFASIHGAAWYGLEPSKETVTLEKQIDPVSYPPKLAYDEGHVTVFDPGHPLHWAVVTG